METGYTPQTSLSEDAYLLSILQVRQFIYSRFAVKTLHVSGGAIRFEASAQREPWREVKKQARALGYSAYRQQWGGRIIVTLVRIRAWRTADEKKELRTSWLLFIATICTTLLAGYLMAAGDGARPWWQVALEASSFSAGLLLILGAHEMSHKIAAMRNGVEASPPKFIPVPTIIGTLGAFIRLRSPLPDENAAVDLGISGPVGGFIVAIPILVAGILLSDVRAVDPAAMQGGLYFAEPLLFKFIAYTLLGIPSDSTIFIHPLAFAGWVGLLVTMLNLMPIGQLDGGHIARAMLGPRGHRILSYGMIAALVGLGLATQYSGWYLWAAIAAFFLRFPYPQHAGAIAPLRARNIALAVLGLAILVLCFMPMPVSVG